MTTLTRKGHVLTSTVSEGTLRPQDLISRFMDVLENIMPTPEWDAFWAEHEVVLETLCPEGSGWLDPNDPYWVSDEVSFFLNESLFEALNEQAPDGWYFGAHEGDGACFGFWRNEEATETEDGPTKPGTRIMDRDESGSMTREVMIAGAFAARDLWAALRNVCSISEVLDMVRQDVEASNMPESVVETSTSLLRIIEGSMKREGL